MSQATGLDQGAGTVREIHLDKLRLEPGLGRDGR
jgi:hypothetical protein